MKKIASLFIFPGIFFMLLSGCVTMPEQIKDEYLADKTEAQGKKLDEIEQSIISKKKEKDQAEKKYSLSKQSVTISEKKLNVLEEEESLLKEEGKLSGLKNDPAGKKAIEEKIKAKLKEIDLQKLMIKYRKAYKDRDKAEFEVNEAEMAVLVAQLNLEKAKIAEVYLEKKKKEMEEGRKDKKEEEEKKGITEKFFGKKDEYKIELKKYEDFYNKKKEELEKKNKDLKEAVDKLNKSLEELKKSGFQGEV